MKKSKTKSILACAVLASVLGTGLWLPNSAEAEQGYFFWDGNKWGSGSGSATVSKAQASISGIYSDSEFYTGYCGEGTADVTSNEVGIIGERFSGNYTCVYAGYAGSGSAAYNRVAIYNGTFGSTECNFYGGYSRDGLVSENVVLISGGTFSGTINIYGGWSGYNFANDNTVVINNGTFNGITNIYGGTGLSTGNTLQLGTNLSANEVNNFQKFVFTLPTVEGGSVANKTMLTANGAVSIDDATSVIVYLNGYTGSDITLISKVDGSLSTNNVHVYTGTGGTGTPTSSTDYEIALVAVDDSTNKLVLQLSAVPWYQVGTGETKVEKKFKDAEAVQSISGVAGDVTIFRGAKAKEATGTDPAISLNQYGDINVGNYTLTINLNTDTKEMTVVGDLTAKSVVISEGNTLIMPVAGKKLNATDGVANSGTLTIGAGDLLSNVDNGTTGTTGTVNLGAGELASGKKISGGTLNITGNVTANAGDIAGGTNAIAENMKLTLNGGDLANVISGAGNVEIAGAVSSSAANFTNTGTLSVASNNTLTLTTGALNKAITNSGTVKLTGVTGMNAAVTGGTLEIDQDLTTSAANIAGTTKNTIANGKKLTLSEGTLAGNLSGDGSVVVNGEVTSAKTIDNAVEINSGKKLINTGTINGVVTNKGTFITTANGITGGVKNTATLELTGGDLGSEITDETTPTGTTTVSGNVTNNNGKSITQKTLTIAEGGFLTTDVSKLVISDTSITNNGGLTLNGSTAVNNDIGGNGTLTVDGTLSSAKTIDNAVTINSGKKLTNTGTLSKAVTVDGTLDNTGTLSDVITVNGGGLVKTSADKLVKDAVNKGNVELGGGTLAVNITDATGTTKLTGDVALKNGKSIAGTLDGNGKTVTLVSDAANTIDTFTVGKLKGNFNLVLDVDMSQTTPTADKLAVTTSIDNSTAINIKSINITADKEFTVPETVDVPFAENSTPITFLTLDGSAPTNGTYTVNNDGGTGAYKDADQILLTTTNQHTYKFKAGTTNGTIDCVEMLDPLTLKEFLEGTKYSDGDVETLSLTDNYAYTDTGAVNMDVSTQSNSALNINLNGHTLNQNTGVMSVTTGEKTLNIDGGSETVAGSTDLNFVVSAAVTESPAKNAGTLNISGNIKLTGDVNNGGNVIFAGTTEATGTLSGAGSYTNSGALTIADASKLTMDNGLKNTGTLNLGGDSSSVLGARITDDATATGTTNINGDVESANAITQSEVIIADGKTLTMTADLTATTVTVGDDSGLIIGAGNLKADVTNGGTVTLNAGTLADDYTITGGKITIGGPVSANVMNLLSTGGITNASSTLTLTDEGALSDDISGNGTTVIDGTISNAKTIANAVTIESDKKLTNTGTISGAVTNEGTFDVTGGSVTGNITNSSTLNVSGGTVKLVTNTGTMNVTDVSALTDDITNTNGIVNFDEANATLTEGVTVTGGTINVKQNLTATVTDLASASGINNKATLTLTGTGDIKDDINNLDSTTGTTVINGTISNAKTIANAITIESGKKLTNTGIISGAVENKGTFDVTAGSVTGNITNSSTLNISGGSVNTVTNTGTMNVTAVSALTDDITNTSGTVNLGADGTLATGSTITGGTINVNADVTANAADIAGGTNAIAENKKLTLNSGALGGNLSGDGSVVVDGDVSNDKTVGNAVTINSGKKLTNTGTLSKAVTVDGTLDNTGTLSDVVTVTSTGTLKTSAAKLVKDAVNKGNVELSGGTLAVNITDATGTTKLTGDVALKNGMKIEGTLDGNDQKITIVSDTEKSIDTFTVGTLSGNLSVVLDVDMSNFTSDNLVVTALDGNVTVDSINIVKDITPETLELPKEEDNKIVYLTKNSGTGTTTVKNSAITLTNNYKYTVSAGTETGKLKYKVEAVDLTFKKFMEGTLPDYTSDPATLSLTADMANTGTDSNVITVGTNQSNDAINVNLNGHNLTSANESTITINSDKTVNLNGGSEATAGAVDSKTKFSVAGTLAVGGNISLAGDIANTGTVSFAGTTTATGTLSGAGAYSNSGTLTIADASKLTVTGTDGLANTGTLNLGNITSETELGAKITGNGITNIVGKVKSGKDIGNAVVVAATDGEFSVIGGSVTGAVTNNKTMNVSDGSVEGGITNAATGTVTVSGGEVKTGAVTNAGTFNVTNGTVSSAVTNSKTMTLNGTGTVSGAVTITDTEGAVYTITAGTQSGTVDNNKTFDVNGGTVSGAVTNAGTFDVTGGSVTGNITNSSTLNVSGGTVKLVTNTGTMNVTDVSALTDDITNASGTVNFDEADATLTDGVTITGGTINVKQNLTATVTDLASTSGIFNKATLTLTGTGDIKDNINNLESTMGTTVINGTISSAKNIANEVTINSGKKLTNTGTISGAVTNKGTFITSASGITGSEVKNSATMELTAGNLGSDIKDITSMSGTTTITGEVTNTASKIIEQKAFIIAEGGSLTTEVDLLHIDANDIGPITNNGNLTLTGDNSGGDTLEEAVVGDSDKGKLIISGVIKATNDITQNAMEIKLGQSLTMSTAGEKLTVATAIDNSGALTIGASDLQSSVTNATTTAQVNLGAGTLADGTVLKNGVVNLKGEVKAKAGNFGTSDNKVDTLNFDTDSFLDIVNNSAGNAADAYDSIAVGALSGSGILSFDIDLSQLDAGITTLTTGDKFTVDSVAADTNLTLKSIHVTGVLDTEAVVGSEWEAGTKKTYTLFKGATDNVTDNLTMTIDTTGTDTLTNKGYRYEFAQNDTKKGDLDVIRYHSEKGLQGVVQGVVDVDDYNLSQIATYSLVTDYSETNDLGTLGSTTTRADKPLTIDGNGHVFGGNSHTGITLQNSGDTLNLKEIKEISGWNSYVVNNGTGGTVNISNGGVADATKVTKLDSVLTGAGTFNLVAGSKLAVENASNLQNMTLSNAGVVDLGGNAVSELKGTISGGTLNIVGDVNALAAYILGDTNTVSEGKNLNLTGGTLTKTVAGAGNLNVAADKTVTAAADKIQTTGINTVTGTLNLQGGADAGKTLSQDLTGTGKLVVTGGDATTPFTVTTGKVIEMSGDVEVQSNNTLVIDNTKFVANNLTGGGLLCVDPSYVQLNGVNGAPTTTIGSKLDIITDGSVVNVGNTINNEKTAYTFEELKNAVLYEDLNMGIADTDLTATADQLTMTNTEKKLGLLALKGHVDLGEAGGLAITNAKDTTSTAQINLQGDNALLVVDSSIAFNDGDCVDDAEIFKNANVNYVPNVAIQGVTGTVVIDKNNAKIFLTGIEEKGVGIYSIMQGTGIDGSQYFDVENDMVMQDGGDTYRIVELDGEEQAALNAYLDGTTAAGQKIYAVRVDWNKVEKIFTGGPINGQEAWNNMLQNDDKHTPGKEWLLKVIKGTKQDREVGRSALNQVASLSEDLGVARAAYDVSRMTDTAISDHLSLKDWTAKEDKNDNVWASFTHNKEKVDGMGLHGMNTQYDAQYNGTSVGYDLVDDQDITLGVVLHYAEGNTTNNFGGHNDSTHTGISIYGQKKLGKFVVQGDVNYLYGSNDLSQNVFGTEMNGKAKTDTISGGLTAKYLAKAGKFGDVGFFTGARYMHINSKKFSDNLGISHEAEKINSVVVPVGLEYNGAFKMKGSDWTWKPRLAAGYLFNLGDRDNYMVMNYRGVADSFLYDFVDKGAFFVKAGMNFTKNNLTLGVGYDYMKSSNSNNNRWNVNLNYAF